MPVDEEVTECAVEYFAYFALLMFQFRFSEAQARGGKGTRRAGLANQAAESGQDRSSMS
jgi:hypothetical protein